MKGMAGDSRWLGSMGCDQGNGRRGSRMEKKVSLSSRPLNHRLRWRNLTPRAKPGFKQGSGGVRAAVWTLQDEGLGCLGSR